MAKYKHDMSGEKARGALLEEGWHDFLVKNVVFGISKTGGNEQFIITLKEAQTGDELDVYAIAVQGKRWFLKMFLAAMSIPASADGVYEWDTSDVIGLYVSGRIEHEQSDPWTDREGKTRPGSLKNRVAEFRASQVPNGTLAEEGPF